MSDDLSLHQEIYGMLFADLAREIDQEIIVNLLVSDGWYKQTINPIIPNDELHDWVEENVSHEYRFLGSVWLFKHIDDFIAFTLRFS
jgi:hypothetical protein